MTLASAMGVTRATYICGTATSRSCRRTFTRNARFVTGYFYPDAKTNFMTCPPAVRS